MSHILHAWDAFYSCAIITTKLCHWWKGTQTWYKFLAIHIENRWTPKCSLPVPYYGIKACVCVKSPQAHTTKDAQGARYARHLAFKRAKNWSNFSCTAPPPTRREVRCRAAHESQAAQVWVGGQQSHTIFIISSSIINVVIYQVPNYWQKMENLESATAMTSE